MKKQNIIAVVLVAILGAVGYLAYDAGQETTDTTQNAVETVQPAEESQTQTQEISISDDGKVISHDGVTGEIALVTLQRLTTVETESSSFGDFVTSINGLAADSSSEFWAFYVNGEQASVGAGTYETQEGDKIEWKLETF